MKGVLIMTNIFKKKNENTSDDLISLSHTKYDVWSNINKRVSWSVQGKK